MLDFESFYLGTAQRLMRFAYGLTGDLAEAQDFTQEAYARAWQRWRRVQRYDNPEGWLRLVVTRLATDRWRWLGVRRTSALPPPDPVPPPDVELMALVAALKQLPLISAERWPCTIFSIVRWPDPVSWVSELTGSGQPKRIYAKPGFQMGTSIEPCGPQLICLVDIKNLDTGEIVALDGNGKEQWRRPAAGDASIMASDTGVILTSHLGATTAYDLSGNPLLPDELGKGRPMWVDSGNLLVMEPSGVTGFSVATKQVTPLGRPAITGFCSWNTTMLTCPTEKGITVWRYAN